MGADALLAVEKLSVFYDAFQAVHDVDLTVGSGEIVSIIGANGAGKSSFLKALVRQAGRVAGSARFDGEDLAALSTRDIVREGHRSGAGGSQALFLADCAGKSPHRLGAWPSRRHWFRSGLRLVSGARRTARSARA